MPKIIMLKGLPASGKSTWAREQVRKSNGKTKRVNKDELREMIDGGQFSKENERKVLEARNLLIVNWLATGFDVIVDDTNLNPVHEGALKTLAPNSSDFEIRSFDTPLEECIARDAKREKPVGEKVIRDMYNRYLKPWIPGVVSKTINPGDITVLHDPRLPNAIICDIDGTLAHMDGRSPFEWSRVGEDKLDVEVHRIVEDSSNCHGNKVILVSGREDICRAETEEWLRINGVGCDLLLMRKAGDNRKDFIVKKEIYDSCIKGYYNVMFVLDDRNQVVKMWREQGLKCLQVAEGDF